MREIKFRGKRQSNGKWFYWSLTTELEYESYIVSEIKLETIGQYTGLKDCKGKEIYEGDIVVDEKYKYIVDNLQSFFEQKGLGEGEYGDDYSQIEVIGNIWENSNLIK